MSFFAVTGGTATAFVFYHGNGLHGKYHSFTAVKNRGETPEESPFFFSYAMKFCTHVLKVITKLAEN